MVLECDTLDDDAYRFISNRHVHCFVVAFSFQLSDEGTLDDRDQVHR